MFIIQSSTNDHLQIVIISRMIQCWPNPAGHPEAFVKSSIFQIDLRLFPWMYAKPVRVSRTLSRFESW